MGSLNLQALTGRERKEEDWEHGGVIPFLPFSFLPKSQQDARAQVEVLGGGFGSLSNL